MATSKDRGTGVICGFTGKINWITHSLTPVKKSSDSIKPTDADKQNNDTSTAAEKKKDNKNK